MNLWMLFLSKPPPHLFLFSGLFTVFSFWWLRGCLGVFGSGAHLLTISTYPFFSFFNSWRMAVWSLEIVLTFLFELPHLSHSVSRQLQLLCPLACWSSAWSNLSLFVSLAVAFSTWLPWCEISLYMLWIPLVNRKADFGLLQCRIWREFQADRGREGRQSQGEAM